VAVALLLAAGSLPTFTNAAPLCTDAVALLALAGQTSTLDAQDSDGDHISDYAEMNYLNTSPCNSNSDGDSVPDGIDGTPNAQGVKIPFNLAVLAINQIELDNECDEGSNWDPYLTAWNVEVRPLSLNKQVSALDWTEGGHQDNRPNENTNPTLFTNGQDAAASGNLLTFQLDPNLDMWGLFTGDVGVGLAGGVMAVDHDDTRHDLMPFNVGEIKIIPSATGGPTSVVWTSQLATDSDTPTPFKCRTQIVMEAKVSLPAEIEETFEALQAIGPDNFVDCGDEIDCTYHGGNPGSPIPIIGAALPYSPGSNICDDSLLHTPAALGAQFNAAVPAPSQALGQCEARPVDGGHEDPFQPALCMDGSVDVLPRYRSFYASAPSVSMGTYVEYLVNLRATYTLATAAGPRTTSYDSWFDLAHKQGDPQVGFAAMPGCSISAVQVTVQDIQVRTATGTLHSIAIKNGCQALASMPAVSLQGLQFAYVLPEIRLAAATGLVGESGECLIADDPIGGQLGTADGAEFFAAFA
jgi:hypothetical protein